MFESLFSFQLARNRHMSAPLRVEREQFLEKLRSQGASHHNLLQTASRLVYVVHYLHLDKLRPVSFEEIRLAARAWVKNREPDRVRTTNPAAIYGFTGIARKFLRFHRRFIERSKSRQPFPDRLRRFLTFITIEKGLSSATVKGYGWHAAQFLEWYSTRHKKLSDATLTDIDYYLQSQAKKWRPWTLRQTANALRSFFHHARTRHWCPAVHPEAIKGPYVRIEHSTTAGPGWSDVQRLLREERQDTPASMRAQVFLLLFALYGLRTSEATGLLLNNFDWKTKTFTVRRAKNYMLQRFPIFPSFGSAVTRYLKLGRPNCQNKYLIVTLHPPYRPLRTGAVAQIISSRMERLSIKSRRKGPQALRHACATRLLSQNMSLQEIADFLGHRDCLSVGIYAKHDLRALKKVVALDLCGGL